MHGFLYVSHLYEEASIKHCKYMYPLKLKDTSYNMNRP